MRCSRSSYGAMPGLGTPSAVVGAASLVGTDDRVERSADAVVRLRQELSISGQDQEIPFSSQSSSMPSHSASAVTKPSATGMPTSSRKID